MILKALSLINYKNFESASFTLDAKINCFVGNNGVGKTNVLDAIYHLSFGKSYFNKNKAYFVPPPAAAGVVEAQILGILGREGGFNDVSSKAQYHFLAEASLIAYVQRGRWMQKNFMSKFQEKNLV